MYKALRPPNTLTSTLQVEVNKRTECKKEVMAKECNAPSGGAAPHARDTTGGAGDIGGTEANRAASRSEILATICTACMAPWCSDGPHHIW